MMSLYRSPKAPESMARSPLARKPLRNPGQSLDEEIDRLLNDNLMAYVFLAGGFWLLASMEWYAKWMAMPRQPGLYGIAALAFTGLLGFKVMEIRRKVRRIRQGRDGEREVAETLQEIVKTGASVIHDIPVEGFNIDHVILSTRGIFVIETKTWSKRSSRDRIDFDGHRLVVSGKTPMRDPIEQCRASSAWLRDLLKRSTGKEFFVRGAVVFPGWWVEQSGRAPGKRVWALNPRQLQGWIAQEQELLEPSEVAMVTYHLQQYVRNHDILSPRDFKLISET